MCKFYKRYSFCKYLIWASYLFFLHLLLLGLHGNFAIIKSFHVLLLFGQILKYRKNKSAKGSYDLIV